MYKGTLQCLLYWYSNRIQQVRRTERDKLEEKIFIRVFLATSCIEKKKRGRGGVICYHGNSPNDVSIQLLSHSLFLFFSHSLSKLPSHIHHITFPLFFFPPFRQRRTGGEGVWGTKLFSYYYFFLLFSAGLSAQVIARESLLLAVSIFCFSFSERKESEKKVPQPRKV